MRKKELAQAVEDLKESVRKTEVEFAIKEMTWKQEQARATQLAGWSSLDKAGSKRNRTYSDVKENIEDAYGAWCTNPLAKSYVDYQKFFVIGKGTQITSEDGDEAEARIKLFCEANDWSNLEKDITEELSRDGEVFIRFHERNVMDVKSEVGVLSLIDPLEIVEIRLDDKGDPDKYIRRYSPPNAMTAEEEEIPASEIHHIAVNKSHYEQRGRSDLLVALPWMKQLRSWIADMSRRNYNSGAINWDVTVKNALSPSDVSTKYGSGPMPGSVIVHTESEEWKVNSPDMKWADSSQGARAIKLLIMAAFKQPESWYGDTGESNLATTKALSTPTLRAFVDKQDFLKGHFEKIISRGANVESVNVTFPELAAEEAEVRARALLALSSAILNLQTAGVISTETAYGITAQFIDGMDGWTDDESGVGELERIQKEESESTARIAAGQSPGGLVRPGLEKAGAPVQPPDQG